MTLDRGLVRYTRFTACCTYSRYVVAGPSLQLIYVAHGKLLSLIAVQKLRCAACIPAVPAALVSPALFEALVLCILLRRSLAALSVSGTCLHFFTGRQSCMQPQQNPGSHPASWPPAYSLAQYSMALTGILEALAAATATSPLHRPDLQKL